MKHETKLLMRVNIIAWSHGRIISIKIRSGKTSSKNKVRNSSNNYGLVNYSNSEWDTKKSERYPKVKKYQNNFSRNLDSKINNNISENFFMETISFEKYVQGQNILMTLFLNTFLIINILFLYKKKINK